MARVIKRTATAEELEATKAIIDKLGGPTVAAAYLGGAKNELKHGAVRSWMRVGPDRGWQVALGALFPKIAPKNWRVR